MQTTLENFTPFTYDSESQNLYIVLSRPRTMVAALVGLFTSDLYTHSSISLDGSIDIMYSFSRKWKYYPFYGGFVCEQFGGGLLKRFKNLPGTVICIKVTPEQYERAKQMILHMKENQKRYKYDYLGFFGNVFSFGVNSNKRFTCSKFVAFLLQECGVKKFDLPLNLVRPQSLLSCEGSIVFEGDLKKYFLKSQIRC